MVTSATKAATTANTGTGARKISASTIGISTRAVAMRLSKGKRWAPVGAAKIFARIQKLNHRGHGGHRGPRTSSVLSVSSVVKVFPRESQPPKHGRRHDSTRDDSVPRS